MDMRSFVEKLEPDRLYKVERNPNYTQVLPSNMSPSDITELMERERTRGPGSLLEGSTKYQSTLLG